MRCFALLTFITISCSAFASEPFDTSVIKKNLEEESRIVERLYTASDYVSKTYEKEWIWSTIEAADKLEVQLQFNVDVYETLNKLRDQEDLMWVKVLAAKQATRTVKRCDLHLQQLSHRIEHSPIPNLKVDGNALRNALTSACRAAGELNMRLLTE